MTRDDEIAEQYEQQADAEHHVALFGPDGEVIDPDSIRARLSVEAHERIDAIMRREDGIYRLEEIRDIGSRPC